MFSSADQMIQRVPLTGLPASVLWCWGILTADGFLIWCLWRVEQFLGAIIYIYLSSVGRQGGRPAHSKL
ncbi:hypothetical protein L6452_34149 [Arctium lappa]|uniref:Uncharacterized protein n=1 Tax=Arctium lappa TaxID=4217 RepID=A0ACB8YHF4_ARCLA|nr:hypothetical protein L6452_34149 [Arctium lappa]